ncbi:MAG: Pycsar system effector family protein [Pseudomonadota bacterium]
MPQSLEDLPLDVDVESREGVSINYISRDRVAYLIGQNHAMVTQTQFADAKAGAVLAFVGLVASRGPGDVTGLGVEALTWDGAILICAHAAALICCLIVLFPRYANYDVRSTLSAQERFSWPSLTAKEMTADRYAAFMRTVDISQMVISISRSNHALAAILHRKFAWLRAAFAMAIIDVILIGARFAFGL